MLLDSGAEASLIHAKLYNNINSPSKLKKQNACLQSVKGYSIKVDGFIILQ